ncbi:Class E basic helix-loop-helix protein 40 [Galemys pyrenaicus]|uniref:Class E basic helix-loop-helix protein 40 n=1 Tax=Galemys pyrenaicus TaxID=202257 RepID=A0A8J6AGL7_GALPY|nr:Class E basic helix-loop-helix protein 40 [Galemys pyrenaicus]
MASLPRLDPSVGTSKKTSGLTRANKCSRIHNVSTPQRLAERTDNKASLVLGSRGADGARALAASLRAERSPSRAEPPRHARPQLRRRSPRSSAQPDGRQRAQPEPPSPPGRSRADARVRERTAAPARRAMERIPSAQPPPACLPKAPALEPADLSGVDFAHMYQVYKSRRGIKRSEDSKVSAAPRPPHALGLRENFPALETGWHAGSARCSSGPLGAGARAARGAGGAPPPRLPAARRDRPGRSPLPRCAPQETYKLPHRLIEKKRRDRINECIAQLKDLLPEHLKLTTLGHLEKAVVLELTLKHVKALTNLIDQQQQKILALQSGLQAGELSGRSIDAGQEMFCSGFQTCAREVLQYLAKHENTRDVTSSQLVTHLHHVVSELLPGATSRKSADPAPKAMDFKEKPSALAKGSEGPGKNCVPVIQRTFAHSSGEQSGSDTDTDSGYGGESEKGDLRGEHPYFKSDHGCRLPVGERISAIKQESEEPPPKKSRMQLSDDEGHFPSSDLISSPFLGPHPHQPPFCLPFYLIPPSATAYLPMLEKCWYPTSVPVLYPGLNASAAALSSFMNPDKLPAPLLMPQRLPSPLPAHPAIDSSALFQALKQIPPLNLEAKD